MGKFNLNSSLFSFHIFLFSLFTFCNLITGTSTDQLTSNPLQAIGCSVINCGQGTCVSSNTSLLGFNCECKSGWKKLQIGPLFFPSCLVPNCTINLKCSNVSSPSPPPSATPNLPHLNLSDPCATVWCGDGTCAANGTGHTCQCFQGSENLFDNSAFACFAQCTFGASCKGLGLGLPVPPPPSPSKSGSPGNGPTQASNNSSNLGRLAIILLVAATIQTWF